MIEAEVLGLIWATALWRARKGADLTQDQLAKKIGASRTFISRMERGKKDISDPMKVLLARTLNLNPAELFAWPTTIKSNTYKETNGC